MAGKNRQYICMCLLCGHVYFSELGRLKVKKNAGCLRCSKRKRARVGDYINGFEIVDYLREPSKNRTYLARCDLCNCIFKTTLGALYKRQSDHCGCGVSVNSTHGMSNTYEYKCWLNMKSRVLNPNTPSYKHYVVKRNLTLDDCWLTFENFYEDMGNAPSLKHTVERINNSKGYSPSNCAWKTMREQSRNTSRNVWCEYENTIYCLTDLCLKLGIRYNTIVTRKHRGHQAPFEPSGIFGVKFLD